jgi:signal transduction histidine kinase
MRASLTCPLIALGKPIGFMFFSSTKPFTYQRVHTELFVQVAGQLSMIVEKGRLYQQLVELNELKNKFLGMAAHDLRNPISAIKGLSEVMLEVTNQGLTPDGLDILKMIHDASEMMLLLVNDLLDVNAIESGRVVVRLEPHDIREVLQACLRANRITAHHKSIELSVEVNESVPTLNLDAARIEHVVNILISNAIKYSRSNTLIVLRARTVGDEVHVSVIDQGQGIPASELKNLFRDFSRTSVRPTAGEKSTGLGLAIARRVVEAHQGRIWAESTVGVGSTFTFSIPIVHQG